MAEPQPANVIAETAVPEATQPAEDLGPHQHCVMDRPTPSGQEVAGEIIKLNDVDTYVSKPAGYPQSPARLVLFLTGGTGIRSVNNQLQADRFSRDANAVVVMPDLFGADPAPNTERVPESEARGALDMLRLGVVEMSKRFIIDMWMARHTERHVMPVLYRVLDAVRDEFADAVTSGGGVYAVGYCVGGRYVFLLGAEKQDPAWGWEETKGQGEDGGEQATTDAEEGRPKRPKEGPLIKAGAVAHAAQVTAADFVTLKVPVSIVCVQDDPLFPEETRVAAEDAMSGAALEHEVTVYPGVPHGFAVVGEYEDEHIKEAQATAYEQMLKWLQEH